MGDRRSHGILKVITACSEDDKTHGLLRKLGTCVHITNWTIFPKFLSRILRRRAAADATMFLPDVTVVLEELMQLTLTVAALKYIAGVLTNEVNAMLPSGRGNTTF